MTITLKHKSQGCNGWCLIPKEHLTTNDSRNYHIVEASVSYNKDEQAYTVDKYNPALETCCGLHIKADAKYMVGSAFPEAEVNKFRSYLATKQNGGWEICGNCVGHFYKDHE